MSGYPVSANIFSGSLHGQWPASAVFLALLSVAGDKGKVLAPVGEIIAMTGMDQELFFRGLDWLRQPDPQNASQELEGRRVVAIGSDLFIVGWPCTREFDFRNLRPSQPMWAEIRQRIFERDDYTCRYCGQRGGRLECDHVMPVSRGGEHTDDNLVTACFSCNRSKRAQTPEEWGVTLRNKPPVT